jgi:hypothetical protein
MVVAGNVITGTLDGTGNGALTNDGSPNTATHKNGDFAGL